MARYPSYAPDFRIQLDGQPMPLEMRSAVTSLSYQDGLEGADRVEFTLANDNLRWLDHPLLQMDIPLTLSIGYAPDPLQQVFVGELTGVNVTFPNGGMPTVTVVAHDFLQRLTKGTKDRAFQLNIPCIGDFPIPDPLVASVVALGDLLLPYPDPVGAALSFLTLLIAYAIDPVDARQAVRIQQSESDFDFLSRIARENGWEMYIDHSLEPQGYVLRFQFLIQDYAPSVELKWGASLLDFTPKISTVGQVAGVSIRIWVASIQTEFVIVLAWDYDRAAFDLQIYPGFGNLASLVGSDKAGKVITAEPSGPATAPKAILSELLPRLNNRLTGSGSAVGDPAIKAGKVINLVGLGDQFGGLYRITSATHAFDASGYRTSFDVRKEVWFGSMPVPKGASGLFRVQGQTIR